MHFKSAKCIFSTKMQKTESVDDFIAKIQQLARSIKADEKMIKFAILNGLLPHISNYVTQKQPTTMTELIDAARIGEMISPPVTELDAVVTEQLAGVQEQLRKLTAKWDNANVVSVNSRTITGQERQRTPPRGQSPRRVQFADEQQQFNTYDRSPPGYVQRGRYPRRGGRGRNYSSFGRGYGGYGRGYGGAGYRGGYTGGYYGQASQYDRQPVNQQTACDWKTPSFYGDVQNQAPYMTYQGQPMQQPQCPKCGGQVHENFNSCPAVNKNCRFCSKIGHFARVCRAAARIGRMQ